jgi:hypothetical protein
VIIVFVAPNKPKKDERGNENKGQTKADEAAGGHKRVIY